MKKYCEDCIHFTSNNGECECDIMDELTDDEALDIFNLFGDASECSKWGGK